MDITSRMVHEWSTEEDILEKSRSELLFNPRDGLKLRTEGYQWLRSMTTASGDMIICVNPNDKYTVSEEFGLGQVDNLCVVTGCLRAK